MTALIKIFCEIEPVWWQRYYAQRDLCVESANYSVAPRNSDCWPSGNTNYSVAPSGHIEFQITGQVVIPIMLLHQVVILNFRLLAKG